MQKTFQSLMIVLALISSGCSLSRHYDYKMNFVLDKSPKTINARAKIETFIVRPSVVPFPLRNKSKTDEEMASEATDIIMESLQTNKLFVSVNRSLNNPDIIIRGRINQIKGQSHLNTLGWWTILVNPLWFFGLPVHTIHGEVDLEISIFRPDGVLVGNYLAHSTRFNNWHTMYNRPRAIFTMTNEAFNEAMGRIREQILADEDKIASSVQ